MSAFGGYLALQGYSFRRRLFGWKALPTLAIALVPSLVAFLFVRFADQAHGGDVPSPYRLYGEFLAPMSLYFVLPFASMLTMLPVLHELYDRGSIAYLVTRPAPRWVSLAGLYGGGLLAALPFLAVAAILPTLLLLPESSGIDGRFWFRRTLGLAGVLWIGCAPYGALCLFLGVWSRKAVLWALGLLIGWGSIAGSITGPLRTFSPHRYLGELMREWLDIENAWGSFFVPDPEPPGVFVSVLALAAFTVLFLGMAIRAVRHRDIL
ncbi:MAG TPA: hypothetical protein VGC54_07590 [Planctomycetota bacterium]